MSGDEADESSVGDTSYEDEDIPLPVSPFKAGTTEPIKLVLKGGKPWGFELKGGSENKAPLQVSQIEIDGKAYQGGQLQVDDCILSVNDVGCTSKVEAEQLIDSAFRTLTLQVWRGTSEPLKSPVQSSSFLLKARELQERARQQAAAQDDSAVFAQSKSATSFKMKPRQRRIESFHGRRPSAQSNSSLSSSSSSSRLPQRGVSPRGDPVATSLPQRGVSPRGDPVTSPPATGTSPDNLGLKGWATENDLTSGHQPVIMSGSHMTGYTPRHAPLTPSKSSPSLHQDELQAAPAPLRGYSPSPHHSLSIAKSSPDVSEQANYENVTSPLSPKSPTWYQQRFPNRSSVFDFSAAGIKRTQGSPRNSYVGYSPNYSQPSNFSVSSAGNYSSMSNTGVFSSSYMEPNPNRSTSHSYLPSGASITSYDDTPNREHKKNYDRRSLPPQALYQHRLDTQKENIKPEPQSQKSLKSMPTTREENESDSEIPDIVPQPPNDLDLRPMYSPPAPPVRDISSLKYVGFNQNHEKYPSWPVTTANPPPNLGGPPVNSNLNEKSTVDKKVENSQDKKFEAQMSQLSDKNSPGSDRRGSEEEKKARNASDPGFKQKPKKSFYTTRKPKFETPKEGDFENTKTEEERFNEFCSQSKPGYPPPKFDPDGHNYGDEKYNIPSPPERDVPNSNEKFEISLVEKINSVINPGNQYHSPFQYHQYSANSDGYNHKSHKMDMATSPLQNSNMSKIPGLYFQQAMNSQNLLHLPSPSRNMVDSGTSPLGSPSEEKNKPTFRTLTANPRNESFQVSSAEKSRGLIIRQMPYYNTSTQTDDANFQEHQSKVFRNSADISDQSRYMEKSIQAHMSHSSLSSDSESNSRRLGDDRERYLRKEFFSDSRLNQPMSLASSASRSETSSQSSGIGSLNFSDQSSAPMLRKLSEEFYRGKLGVSVPNEKRMSAVNYDELKSPRSESLYGGLKEAESLSSVVIHPQESAGPFGHDDYGSSPSLVSSKQDISDSELDPFLDARHSLFQKPRHSIDSATIFHKPTSSMGAMPPRSLQDSRFTSENNLTSPSYSSRNYSQSMLQLSKPPSVSDNQQRNSSHGSDSSSASSRPHGSMEARSSGSRMGSDSSNSDQRSSMNVRKESSDSVFIDKTSPVPNEALKNNSIQSGNDKQTGIVRKVSMKMAYGTFDENEHHYATPYAHQRNNSENLSPQAKELNIVHAKSHSYADYMPMHYGHGQSPADHRLGQIQEEDSEFRWQEAVRKSKSINPEMGNYMNVDNKEQSDSAKKGKKTDKIKSGMKRTVSEQIRPRKNEAKKLIQQKAVDGATKEQSSSGESSKGNKSDGEMTPNIMSHQFSDSDLKKVQQKAVLDFVERKTKPRSSDESDPQSPSRENPPEFPTNSDKTQSIPASPSPIMMDITRKYNYTRAQRTESLRRSRSISSTSSHESPDYVDMKRPERHYQTEWSRLRSQDGVLPRRPLSIGSDISGTDSYTNTKLSPLATLEGEVTHIRSVSETITTQVQEGMQSDPVNSLSQNNACPLVPSSNDTMVTTPVYQNLGEYPRRPPPPVPGINTDDQPPALPPRSYQQPRFTSSKSESFLFSQIDPKAADEIRDSARQEIIGHKKWENSPREDTYAEQLRKQARRYSEQQHKPMSMQVLATKSPIQVSLSQSFKQEPIQAFEAKPLQKYAAPSTQTTSDSVKELHSPPQKRDTASPELPPLPTPLKNGEVEIKVDLNETADFPPPPAEFAEVGDSKMADECADDSYGSYKTRTSRELGKYKRTQSDSTIVKAHAESKHQAYTELNNSDVTETPNKPPRKKLELQGRDSPTQGQGMSANISAPQLSSAVPIFQAADSKPVGILRSAPQPLESSSVSKVSPQTTSNAGSFVSTVVQRPNANLNSAEKPSAQTDERAPSVRDRIKSIEVIAYSPGSAKSQKSGNTSRIESDSKSELGTPRRGTDSLEKLESSVRSSNSFRDRLRPVVRKVDNNQKLIDQPPYMARSSDRLNEKLGDVPKVEGTPPVPVRTYKNIEGPSSSDRPPRPSSRPGENSESPYRKNSFQLRNSALSHPRPYENKNELDANVQSPAWAKGDNVHNETMKKSIAEPQVPSRVPLRPKPNEMGPPQPIRAVHHEQFSDDQNPITSSRNQRLQLEPSGVSPGSSSQSSLPSRQPRNYDNSQSYSVQSAQKRKSDNSYITNMSPNSSLSQTVKDENVVSPEHKGQNRTPNNVHYDKYQNEEKRGSSEQRGDSVERNSRQFDKYQSKDYNNRRSNTETKSNVDNVGVRNRPESQGQYVSNNPHEYTSNVNEQSLNRKNISDNRTSSEKNADNTAIVTISHRKQPSQEELECDEKAQELARVLQESDKQLSEVLTLDSNKSRMQYMDGLFQMDNEPPRPKVASKKEDETAEEKEQEEQKENTISIDHLSPYQKVSEYDQEIPQSHTADQPTARPTSPMPSNYYVSPPKAMIELEIRKFGDTTQLTQGIGDNNDTLAQKKEELLQRMLKKVDILKDDKKELLSEIADNEKLGKQVADAVEQKCRSHQEKDKFRSYIEDMDKIIRLLLKLSGLLARAENTIQGLTENTNEKIKKMTFDKRDRLHKQHEDAKELKVDIDRRRENVEGILKGCLSTSELEDYHYFIKMKSKYTIQMQELEDKITLGNEQIVALQKSIPNQKK